LLFLSEVLRFICSILVIIAIFLAGFRCFLTYKFAASLFISFFVLLLNFSLFIFLIFFPILLFLETGTALKVLADIFQVILGIFLDFFFFTSANKPFFFGSALDFILIFN